LQFNIASLPVNGLVITFDVTVTAIPDALEIENIVFLYVYNPETGEYEQEDDCDETIDVENGYPVIPEIRVHVQHLEIQRGTGNNPVFVGSPQIGTRYENSISTWNSENANHDSIISASNMRNNNEMQLFDDLSFVRWNARQTIRFYNVSGGMAIGDNGTFVGLASYVEEHRGTNAAIEDYLHGYQTVASFSGFPAGVTDIVIEALWERDYVSDSPTIDPPIITPPIIDPPDVDPPIVTPPPTISQPPPPPTPPTGGDDDGSDDETPVDVIPPVDTPVVETPAAETPVVEVPAELTPGGNDPNVPPIPTSPNHTLVQYGDMWIELDEDGVPLGTWHWDEDEEMWIFDDNVPRGALAPATPAFMPQTGLEGLVARFGALFALAFAVAIAAFVMIKREAVRVNKK